MLALSAIILTIHFAGWAMISAQVVPFNQLSLACQCITAGVGGALWNMGNVRMVMGIVPLMGRAHFLALYSVIFNVTFGLSPLLLAPAMDWLKGWSHPFGMWTWNSYSILYLLLAFVNAVGLVLILRIHEPKAMTWDRFVTEVFIKTPGRGMSRLFGRWRGSTGTGWG
jgi:hypothetical protein